MSLEDIFVEKGPSFSSFGSSLEMQGVYCVKVLFKIGVQFEFIFPAILLDTIDS